MHGFGIPCMHMQLIGHSIKLPASFHYDYYRTRNTDSIKSCFSSNLQSLAWSSVCAECIMYASYYSHDRGMQLYFLLCR